MNYHLRPLRPGDGKWLNELRRMPGVFEDIAGLPTERLGKAEAFIDGLDDFEHHVVAVFRDAEGEERVVGACGISLDRNPRRRHVASLGIMVHKDYQNRGIGGNLLKAILDLADNWLMLVRIELEVFVDNAAAVHLYEKYGFEREGVKRYRMIRDGKYADLLVMSRLMNLVE